MAMFNMALMMRWPATATRESSLAGCMPQLRGLQAAELLRDGSLHAVNDPLMELRNKGRSSNFQTKLSPMTHSHCDKNYVNSTC